MGSRSGAGEIAGGLRGIESLCLQGASRRGHAEKILAAAVVVQHGDPGTWNILVRRNGGISLLDWEAGEPKGMPLWDLLYFMRSFGCWISRTGGRHDALASFSHHFVSGASQLSTQLILSTRRYCHSVGLDSGLVEPLFYTCWMHRALKESTRIPAHLADQAHYFRLLQLCLRNRDEPGLKALFCNW